MNNTQNNQFDNFPWNGNDIYLEDSKKQIKAVCSNALIANEIAKIVNSTKNKNTSNSDYSDKIQQLIKASYILYVTLPKAKIQIKDISTMFLERAYHDFCNSLSVVLKDYHLDIKDQIDQLEKNKEMKK